MKKKPFTEERIIAVLKGHEFGATAADFSRKHGISPQTPCGFTESGNFRNSLVRWFVRWFLKETMSSARTTSPTPDEFLFARSFFGISARLIHAA